ncbi:hypothetical protein ACIPPM_13970 [Streptomyces sp. NPDC090119]|uniref:hypothetical protein n=1 Tax=Streptomyces sp. NPDC090119 TaxID=3365951 RepID=UPI0038050A4A
MRKFAAAGVAVVVLGGSLGLATTEAVAAPQAGKVVQVAQGTAPSCVKVERTKVDAGYPAYKVTNNCSGTKKLKGIFKYGYDSACESVKKSKSALLTSSQPWVDYDKVVTC